MTADRSHTAETRSRERNDVLGWARFRHAFPAVEELLYFDAAHQTPLSLPVREELDRFYGDAMQWAGPKTSWLKRAEAVRSELARTIGGQPAQLAFTKNTSEGLNVCANGIAWRTGDNVVLPAEEHPNNAYAWLAQRRRGLEVRLVPADKEWLDADSFAPYVDAQTRVITLSHVMFHTGQRNDLDSIVRLAREIGAAVVVDAMQSVGVHPINVAQLGVTALAAGAHKGLLTPHGLGFLYVSDAADLEPTYVGLAGIANARADLLVETGPIRLRADARRFEVGNPNLAGIHALGASLRLLDDADVARIETHVLDLGDELIETIDSLGIDLLGPREREHRSHIYTLRLTAPEWPEFLAAHSVRASVVRGGIRISFGLYNSSEDVTRLGEILQSGLATINLR